MLLVEIYNVVNVSQLEIFLSELGFTVATTVCKIHFTVGSDASLDAAGKP